MLFRSRFGAGGFFITPYGEYGSGLGASFLSGTLVTSPFGHSTGVRMGYLYGNIGTTAWQDFATFGGNEYVSFGSGEIVNSVVSMSANDSSSITQVGFDAGYIFNVIITGSTNDSSSITQVGFDTGYIFDELVTSSVLMDSSSVTHVGFNSGYLLAGMDLSDGMDYSSTIVGFNSGSIQ